MKNYIKILIASVYFFNFSAQAVNTWTINSSSATISGLPNGSTSISGSFTNEDNITIATANQDNILTINEANIVIGNLLWCSGSSFIVSEPGEIDIGTVQTSYGLTIRPTSTNVNIGFVKFDGVDNKLILDSSSITPNQTSAQREGGSNPPFPATYASSRYAPTFIGVTYKSLINSDNYGNLELHSSNTNPLGYSFPISPGPNNRLKSLTYSGDGLIEGDVTQSIYAVNVTFDTSGQVIMPPIYMGDGSSISLNQDLYIGTVGVGNYQGSINTGLTVINLNKYKFNSINSIGSASMYGFANSAAPPPDASFNVLAQSDAQINTFFDQTLNDGGRFIVDNNNLFKVSGNMTITLTTNANAAGLLYNLFSGQGQVDVPTPGRVLGNPNSNIDSETVTGRTVTFNQPTPGAIYWTYDPNGYVISSHINPSQVVPPPNSPPYDPQNPAPIAPSNPLVPVITFTDTSVLPANNITPAVARFVPTNSDKVATDEANDTAIRDVATRMFKIPEDDFVSASGVSSGDEVDAQLSGIWLSPFIQKARQKDTSDTYGYKIKNYGGTLGYDRMLGENFALGIAWTTLKANVKLSGFKTGDKSDVDTNIFSIYSLYNMPHRWFMQSHVSAGQSNVKAIEWRYRSDGSLGIADAKYKSYSYNAHASFGKRIYLSPSIDLIPSVGLVYNNVKGGSYSETGDVPTLSVAKRSSYALDALLGARLSGRLEHLDYVFKPELTANAQLNISKRNMKVNFTGDFIEPVTVDVRQSKKWYGLGGGLTVYKGSMEFAVNYERQIDKGYLGYVGMIKIRMNF